LCEYSWRVPENLDGIYKLVPKLRMGPFEHIAAINEIEIRNGQWIAPQAEVVAQTPLAESPESPKKSMATVLVILAFVVLVAAILAGSRRSSASG